MKIPLFDAFQEPILLRDANSIENDRLAFILSHLATDTQISPSDNITPQKHTILESYLDAAKHAILNPGCNKLNNCISNKVDNHFNFTKAKPVDDDHIDALIVYKKDHSKADLIAVTDALQTHGKFLSSGQTLFHGGLLDFPASDELDLSRPLSTSFCPHVALRNSVWCFKPYNNESHSLFMITVKSERIKAYLYAIDFQNDNELEVLISQPAKLKIKKRTLITRDFEIGSHERITDYPLKNICAYLVEADLV